jgi:hypothetical protein
MEQIIKIALYWVIAGGLSYLIDMNKAKEDKHSLSFRTCLFGGMVILLITLFGLYPSPPNSDEEDELY